MMSAHNRTDGDPKWGLVGAVAAAVGASACCLGPLLLLTLGIGGAWIGNLTAMGKYRPYWISATLIFLGLAFFRAYRKSRKEACTPGSACKPDAERRTKVLVWVAAVFIFALLALPYFIPFAFGGEIPEGGR